MEQKLSGRIIVALSASDLQLVTSHNCLLLAKMQPPPPHIFILFWFSPSLIIHTKHTHTLRGYLQPCWGHKANTNAPGSQKAPLDLTLLSPAVVCAPWWAGGVR